MKQCSPYRNLRCFEEYRDASEVGDSHLGSFMEDLEASAAKFRSLIGNRSYCPEQHGEKDCYPDDILNFINSGNFFKDAVEDGVKREEILNSVLEQKDFEETVFRPAVVQGDFISQLSNQVEIRNKTHADPSKNPFFYLVSCEYKKYKLQVMARINNSGIVRFNLPTSINYLEAVEIYKNFNNKKETQ